MIISRVNNYSYTNKINPNTQSEKRNNTNPTFEGVLKTRRGAAKLSIISSSLYFAEIIAKPFLDLKPTASVISAFLGLGAFCAGLGILKKSLKMYKSYRTKRDIARKAPSRKAFKDIINAKASDVFCA